MKTFKVNLIVTTPDVFNTRTIYSSVLEATHDTFEDNGVIVKQIDTQDLSTDYIPQFRAGDTVKIIDNKCEGITLHDIGTIGTVTAVYRGKCGSSYYGVEAQNDIYYYEYEQLEKGHTCWVKE